MVLAFIADVSDREMNRAVDEHILPEPLIRSGNGRRFARLGAALASFYFTSEDVYTATLRRKVVEEVSAMLRARGDMESILALFGIPQRYRLAYQCKRRFYRHRFCRHWFLCSAPPTWKIKSSRHVTRQDTKE